MSNQLKKSWARLAGKVALKAAKKAFDRGEHAEAVKRLLPLVESGSEPAQGLLAQAYAEQGLFDELDALIGEAATTTANERLRLIAGALAAARQSDWQTRSAVRLIQYSPQVSDRGAGHDIPVPYQSTAIGAVELPGFREPAARLRAIPIDFQGKSVLEIGCNLGGFLLPLAPTIRWGVGVDNNARNINVCQKLRSARSAVNLDFYAHDIETQPLNLLEQFLPEPGVDTAFVMRIMSDGSLSGLLGHLAGFSAAIVFEPIASHPAREADIETLKRHFASVQVIETDIVEPLDGGRHTLYCATDRVAAHGR